MLHELLISLRGHPGYVFVDKEDKMMVNPTLTFLHPCEVSVSSIGWREICGKCILFLENM